MQKKSTVKNLGYQTFYQLFSTAMPLITAPYLARTLGATQQGVYSYANSIVSYFILFSMLGINNYGTRKIAAAGDHVEKRSAAFFNTYTLQVVTCLTCLAAYIVYLACFCRDNFQIAALLILELLACLFNVTWLYFGTEEFKATVIRNFFVKLATVVMILVLVKRPEDLWLYALLTNGSNLIGNIVLWLSVKKRVHFVKPDYAEIRRSLKPIMVLFIPILAMSVYQVMDKTMLGILSDYDNSGFYYNADRVVNIPLGIITGISTVLFPRAVSVLNTENKGNFLSLFSRSTEGTMLIACAFSFGIAAVSAEFTPVFFGPGFEACAALIVAFAPIIILKSLSAVVRYQYLVPMHEEHCFTWSVLAGACVNLAVNLLLIPLLGAMGAVLGTMIAELVACVSQIWFVQKETRYLPMLFQSVPYVIIGLVMYAAVRGASSLLPFGNLLKLLVEIMIGAAVYLLLCCGYSKATKNNTIVGEILNMVFRFLKKYAR